MTRRYEELVGWDLYTDNPSWHCGPWSIYWRLNKYDLYRSDKLVATFDTLDEAATFRMKIVKQEIEDLGR